MSVNPRRLIAAARKVVADCEGRLELAVETVRDAPLVTQNFSHPAPIVWRRAWYLRLGVRRASLAGVLG
jgi:hypothetical protein